MRKEPLLTAVPPAPVRSLSELYAIALDQAQRATHRYGAIATQLDERLSPVRSVFEALATREQNRSGSLSAACLAACGKRPDASDLRWAPIDLVPAAEIADIKNSSLSTPYTAWVLAARHRQRAFVFWTYVIALAEDPLVRLTAETWRMKHCPTVVCCVASGGWPGGLSGRSPPMRLRLLTEPTRPHRQRFWKAFSSRTSSHGRKD